MEGMIEPQPVGDQRRKDDYCRICTGPCDREQAEDRDGDGVPGDSAGHQQEPVARREIPDVDEIKRGPMHDIDDVIIRRDRKSTRLNSSHPSISYAVFCLKKKT